MAYNIFYFHGIICDICYKKKKKERTCIAYIKYIIIISISIHVPKIQYSCFGWLILYKYFTFMYNSTCRLLILLCWSFSIIQYLPFLYRIKKKALKKNSDSGCVFRMSPTTCHQHQNTTNNMSSPSTFIPSLYSLVPTCLSLLLKKDLISSLLVWL